jgi:transposase
MSRKKYTTEFKQQAVKLVTEQGYTIVKAAQSLGVSNSNIHRWLAQFSDASPVLSKKYKPDPNQEELNRLRKENLRLKQEREILKKAAAFFANERM